MKKSRVWIMVVVVIAAGAAAQNSSIPVRPAPSSLPPTDKPIVVPPPGLKPIDPSAVPPSGVITVDRSVPFSSIPKPNVNYWQLVSDLLRGIQTAPPRGNSIGRGLDVSSQEYPFEALKNLRGIDMIRAAKEGASVARLKNAGQPEIGVEQGAYANAAMCLEYFPMVVRDDNDRNEILKLLNDYEQDRAVRRYLLENLAPDAASPSLMTMWLNDAYSRFQEEFNKAFESVCSHPSEDPSVQVLGIRIYYARLFSAYRDIFNTDPKITALAEQTGRQVELASVAGETPPEMEKKNHENLIAQGRLIAKFADLIAEHLSLTSTRDERVKKVARDILQNIAANVVVPDKEVILRYLDPARPAPKQEPSAASELPPGMMSIPINAGGGAVSPPVGGGGGLSGPQVIPQGVENQSSTPVPLPQGL